MAYQKLGPGTLTLGDQTTQIDLSCQVASATLTPSTDVGDPTVVLCGDVLPGAETTTWTLNANLVTDLTSAGFVKWVWDHAGQVVPFEYVPSNEVGTSFAGNVKIGYIPIGGDVNETMMSEVEWTIIGTPAPTFGDAVASETYPSQYTYPSTTTYPTMSVPAGSSPAGTAGTASTTTSGTSSAGSNDTE